MDFVCRNKAKNGILTPTMFLLSNEKFKSEVDKREENMKKNYSACDIFCSEGDFSWNFLLF